jgi:flagellar basal body-associated protein FliL
MDIYHTLGEREENNNYKRKNSLWLIIAIIIIIILLLILFLSLYLVRRRTQITGKAYGPVPSSQVELSNSYMFASPLKAKANDMERIRMTVFILDSQGKGVMGKQVIMGQQKDVTIDTIQNPTDEVGQAIFDITSSKKGLYIIEASVDGKALNQRVNITFE